LNVKDATKELKHFEVEYAGSGTKVVEQSPEGGERLEEGSKVRLFLGD
jgi:hypothetical protein